MSRSSSGGDETTRHVISNGIHQLLLQRSQWEPHDLLQAARAAGVKRTAGVR